MTDGKLERPFYFMVPFWGERYRDYFVDLCLPSLLAPNNIPLLSAEDGHCFLIATTREDWEAIEHLPIMERLRQHATPTWIEISSVTQSPATSGNETYVQYVSAIEHHTLCQKKLLDRAYRDRAYGCVLFPDLVVSDGMVAALLKYAQAGYHLVSCSALRQTEEAVLEDLLKRDLLPQGERLSITGRALTIPPRVMADLFVRHLHPDVTGFEYGTPIPHRPFAAPFRFWRMPDSRGMLLHTFFVVPILMDFTAVPANHMECLERDIFENVYCSENFGQSDRIRIIQDSDEFCVMSLTPVAVTVNSSLQQTKFHHLGWMQEYDQLRNIRESVEYYVGRNHDVMRRDLFQLPIRWHAAALDEVWRKEERRIERLIHYAVGDYYRISRPPHTRRFPAGFSLDPRVVLIDAPAKVYNAILTVKNHLTFATRIIGKRVGLGLCGDKVALRWWGWRLRKLGSGLIGRPFQEPKPPTPE